MKKVYVVVRSNKIGFDGYYGEITIESGECVFRNRNLAEEYIQELKNSPDFDESEIKYEIWELELKD